MRNRAIFLDRDGTINVDFGYISSVDKVQFIDGAIEGLKLLMQAGYMLIIVTNQSGIARGYYTEEDFHIIMSYMYDEFEKNGIKIVKTYYCPHLGNCKCRKPNLGMFYEAISEFNIDIINSKVIGDKLRDLNICNFEKIKGYYITDTGTSISNGQIKCSRSLLEAAKYILMEEK